MTKVVVIGSSGLIGSKLAHKLRPHDVLPSVVGADRYQQERLVRLADTMSVAVR